MTVKKDLIHAERPTKLLSATAARYPRAFKDIDDIRMSMRGTTEVPDWPDWCYAPLACSQAAIAKQLKVDVIDIGLAGMESVTDAPTIAAVTAWRKTRGVYNFDLALYNELRRTPLEGPLPCELLLRLPEWCVYVVTPDMRYDDAVVHGCFVHLEHDIISGRSELRLLFDVEDHFGQLFIPIPIHIGKWTLVEGIDRMCDVSAQSTVAMLSGIPLPAFQRSQELDSITREVVNLILYLCTEASDISGEHGQPGNPTPKNTKKGIRLFAAQETREWQVGARLGSALRKAQTSSDSTYAGSSRKGPRPHIRRAHWHTYFRGPRFVDGQRSTQMAQLKWIPPTPVMVYDEDKLPAVVYPMC